eukprot:scaffold3430_cov124-Skeletonema_menzelii.AAC.3
MHELLSGIGEEAIAHGIFVNGDRSSGRACDNYFISSLFELSAGLDSSYERAPKMQAAMMTHLIIWGSQLFNPKPSVMALEAGGGC